MAMLDLAELKKGFNFGLGFFLAALLIGLLITIGQMIIMGIFALMAYGFLFGQSLSPFTRSAGLIIAGFLAITAIVIFAAGIGRYLGHSLEIHRLSRQEKDAKVDSTTIE